MKWAFVSYGEMANISGDVRRGVVGEVCLAELCSEMDRVVEVGKTTVGPGFRDERTGFECLGIL